MRWLDVGAGDAWFAEQLRRSLPEGSEVVCWDVNYRDTDISRAAPETGLILTADRPTGRFDRILLLDVVEHVADDRPFLQDILTEMLAPGGWVLVSVPAYQGLFSRHDTALGHYRRYSPRRMRHLLDAVGLERVAEGGLFHLLLLPRAAQVVLERVRGRGAHNEQDAVPVGIGQWAGGARSTALISFVLRSESRLSLALGFRKRTLPGLSYWALCRVAG